MAQEKVFSDTFSVSALAVYEEFDSPAQLELIPNTLQSIKGIGPDYSAGIIAEIRDINRFPNQAALAKYAGLAWNKHQSGDFEAQNTRLINPATDI